MPRRRADAGTIACPKCGHRFRLDEQVVDHIREDLERSVRQSLRKEVRAELAPEVEQKAAQLKTKELREKDEEVRERDRQIAALKRQITSLSKKLPSPRAQALGDVRAQDVRDPPGRAGMRQRRPLSAQGGSHVLADTCHCLPFVDC